MNKLLPSLVVLTVVVTLAGVPCVTAQTDPVADMLNRVNRTRLAQGLTPYKLNDALTAAAERHSRDMANTGRVDHVGSDQSFYRERILQAGYGQWGFAPIVSENIYGGTGDAGIAFDWWMSADNQRGLILSSRYREIGIAVQEGANGWMYWTVTFGAQPNVLPIFINDGATQVDKPSVLVTLTNENAVPAGEGQTTMGQALQVRLAHDNQLSGAEWQPWQARIPFELLPQSEQQVYVQYRDAQGRVALAWVSVTLTNVPPTSSPTSEPTNTPTPAATFTPLPADTPTSGPTPMLLPTVLPIVPLANLTTPVLVTTEPTLPPSPTHTPRPRPSPRPLATPTDFFISLNNEGTPPAGLVPAWLILQTLAAILGIAMMARNFRRIK
jgi:uncharacterized protein YkwD